MNKNNGLITILNSFLFIFFVFVEKTINFAKMKIKNLNEHEQR